MTQTFDDKPLPTHYSAAQKGEADLNRLVTTFMHYRKADSDGYSYHCHTDTTQDPEKCECGDIRFNWIDDETGRGD